MSTCISSLRRRRAIRVAPIALLGVFACADTPVARTPAVTLTATGAELTHEFLTISSVAELGDGRVIVGDGEDKSLWLADFAKPDIIRLGRNGSGPREYKSVGGVFAIGPDSVLIDDLLFNRRFLIFAAGKLSGTLVLVDANVVNTPPQFIDRAGRVYTQDATFGHDSVAITRWDPKSRRVDTLAFSMTETGAQLSTSARDGEVSMSICISQSPRGDIWDVFADGTVMIARAADYHVDVVAPDKQVTRGRPVKYEPIPVPSTQKSGPCAESAKYFQAFLGRERRAQQASPSGEFWVRRTSARQSDSVRYDVFDRTATFVKQVVLPANTRLVGFGAEHFYLARTEADGSERLRRVTMQK